MIFNKIFYTFDSRYNIIIHVKSNNIIHFILFRNTILKEIIKNHNENKIIMIKLYNNIKFYDKIIGLLLNNLTKFNNIIISKL
jgi:hypothetical protein